ncbi:related to verA protein [Fusarium fujikuroi]|nr:related to verA protein [Fusarium fujikuroi]
MVPSQQDIFCSSRHIDCILPDESLLLPRLLCLHGGGTNALIFHAQCRAIRARLDKTFRFVFINAPYFSHPGPDVESVYAEWIPFRSWKRPGYVFDNDSSQFSFTDEEEIKKIDQCLATAMKRDDEAGGRGPWVGLLGFSQGANMAASLLRRQQTRKKDAQLGEPTAAVLEANFRFAVLMAGCGPLLWMRYDVTGDELERETYQRLYLPTLHVHGLRDERIAKHRELNYYKFDFNSNTSIIMSGSQKLLGKHVLVIGGTSGIGRGVALAAIRDAAHVTVVGSSQATADKAVNYIKSEFPEAKVSGYSCDLDVESLEVDLEALFDKIDPVDHIVTTAANSHPHPTSIQTITVQDLRLANRKLQAMVILAKVASRRLPASRYSSLTFTSGSIADQPQPGCSVLAYIAQGILGFVRGLALDMKPVRVNLVKPGYVLDTGLWSQIPEEQKSNLRDTLANKNPTASEGLVEDVSEAYIYLMKDGNCTGEVVSTRSGQHLV